MIIKLMGLTDSYGRPMQAKSLASRISVLSARKTNVITATFKHKDPKAAADVLNTFAKVSVEHNRSISQQRIVMAKKFIEKGNYGGKGSDSHKAGVVGDTVGDPFKDTSGPSLNILIKLMTMVSVVMAGLTVAVSLF